MPESNYNSEETLDEDKFCEALGGGLLAKIQEIRRSGVERLDDIKLPKICVVGEQSVGKSSVIERLSGIRVPRDQNTCTRVSGSSVKCANPLTLLR